MGVDARQREKIPRVGYLSFSSNEDRTGDTAFIQGFTEAEA